MPRPYNKVGKVGIVMSVQSKPPRRRTTRLRNYDYSQTGCYFVTICSYRRCHIFGEISNGTMYLNDSGMIVSDCWIELPDHFTQIGLDAFVIMPNHVHGIIMLNESTDSPKPSLGNVVGAFKSASTRIIRKVCGQSFGNVWQRNYYEHIIRNEESLDRIRQYIIHNPLSWHLDRENQKAIGRDDFDLWITEQKSWPGKKTLL